MTRICWSDYAIESKQKSVNFWVCCRHLKSPLYDARINHLLFVHPGQRGPSQNVSVGIILTDLAESVKQFGLFYNRPLIGEFPVIIYQRLYQLPACPRDLQNFVLFFIFLVRLLPFSVCHLDEAEIESTSALKGAQLNKCRQRYKLESIWLLSSVCFHNNLTALFLPSCSYVLTWQSVSKHLLPFLGWRTSQKEHHLSRNEMQIFSFLIY